jgi:hypothetical protein
VDRARAGQLLPSPGVAALVVHSAAVEAHRDRRQTDRQVNYIKFYAISLHCLNTAMSNVPSTFKYVISRGAPWNLESDFLFTISRWHPSPRRLALDVAALAVSVSAASTSIAKPVWDRDGYLSERHVHHNHGCRVSTYAPEPGHKARAQASSAEVIIP